MYLYIVLLAILLCCWCLTCVNILWFPVPHYQASCCSIDFDFQLFLLPNLPRTFPCFCTRYTRCRIAPLPLWIKWLLAAEKKKIKVYVLQKSAPQVVVYFFFCPHSFQLLAMPTPSSLARNFVQKKGLLTSIPVGKIAREYIFNRLNCACFQLRESFWNVTYLLH